MTKSRTQNKSSSNNNKQRKFLSADDPVPEDIHWEWLEVIKAIQASLKDNKGFAQVTLKVSVQRNKPILWSPPAVVPIAPLSAHRPQFMILPLSPKRVAEYRFTSETAAALMSLHENS